LRASNGGFFLRKKPLERLVSVYTNSENAIARLALFDPERAQSGRETGKKQVKFLSCVYQLIHGFFFHVADFVRLNDRLNSKKPHF
jgi:hypothetical protein